MKIGIQLFSLKDLTISEDNIATALKDIKNIGYQCIECAGEENLDYIYEKSIELGLEFVSGHLKLDWLEVEENQDKLSNFKDFKYAIVPYIATENRTTEEYKVFVKRMNKLKVQLNQKKIELLYHNHDFEFLNITENFRPIDYFIENGEFEFEYDTYWLRNSGIDVVSFLNKESNKRANILHFKEWVENGMDGCIGSGVIDFEKIINILNDDSYIIVEQEKFINKNEIDEIGKSFAYVSTLVSKAGSFKL